MRTKQLQQEFDLELRWTVFPLHPETPEQGQTLEQLFAGRIDVSRVLAQMQQVADSLNLPFALRSHTYNSRRAQELGKWAEQLGQGEAFRTAVYQAYFADGRNIAKPTELVAIADYNGVIETPGRNELCPYIVKTCWIPDQDAVTLSCSTLRNETSVKLGT